MMATHSSSYEAQLLIDDEIAELTARMQESIRLLKTRRNEFAAVLKLPDEILLHIFLIYQDTTVGYPKEWLQATHICRHWRYIGVGSPSLWTHLYDSQVGLTRLMLERSQNAPLEVSLWIGCSNNEAAIENLTIILHEIERIQRLDINMLPLAVLGTVRDVLDNLGQDLQASLLESLNISVDAEIDFASRPLLHGLGVFRPTHALRSLSIGGCYDWRMLSLPSLTSLKHLKLDGQSLGKISGAQFIDTLRPMRNLESLDLMCDRMRIYEFPPTPRPLPIHLPFLRRMKVDGHHTRIESFLSLVTHPILHQLFVESSCPVDDIVLFTQLVLSSIGQDGFSPLESLRIGSTDVHISEKPEPSEFDGSYIRMFIPVDEEAYYENNYVRGFDFVAGIMSCITFFDRPDKIPLRHLYLDDWDITIDIAEFICVFASLPRLETMEVSHKVALVLFIALDITSASDGTGASSLIPFPKLRTITWHGQYRREPSFLGLSSTAFDALCKTLLSRRACGAALTRLELTRDGLLKSIEISRLEEIGVEVVRVVRW